MSIVVPPYGNLDAPILWVGEAPGREEEKAGRPFVGPSGYQVRRTLSWAGVDVDRDVRFTNVAKINPGTFPKGKARVNLVKEWAADLDKEILEMPNLKVIVACGAQALFRLTGEETIAHWHGNVLRNENIPSVLQWGHVSRLPENIHIVVTLHPAGIIMSGARDAMLLFRRDVQKAASILNGTFEARDFRFFLKPTPRTLEKAIEQAKWVYLDTEYGDDYRMYWMGVTFDGVDVYGFPWEREYVSVVQRMMSSSLLKGAHNIAADMHALSNAGIHIVGPLWDTMLGYHTLHPSNELHYGLESTAAYYVDDVYYWKDMPHEDPMYNALDVYYGSKCMLAQQVEASKRLVCIDDELQSRFSLIPTILKMETRGMLVDTGAQRKLILEVTEDVNRLNEGIANRVGPIWDKRVRKAMESLKTHQDSLLRYNSQYEGWCPKHKYKGTVEKAPNCDKCKDLHSKTISFRESYKRQLKDVKVAERLVERWSSGFKATNSEHLRWLLYSPDGLHLPVKRNYRSKKVSSDAEAIDALASDFKVKEQPHKLELVLQIKEAQQLSKALSTFILLEKNKHNNVGGKVSIIDSRGYVHPRYKIHGTETGRLAGGEETHDDRSINATAFNPLNIPEEWRQMYVAPEGYILVGADWRNIEGRLTAYFSKDPALQSALDDELKGGPKVHSINAATIYNIDPKDAERYQVSLKGKPTSAYKAGKMLTHAWNYLMSPRTMARTYGITEDEARVIDARLSDRYHVLVSYREDLIDKVLGIWAFMGEKHKSCVKEGTRYLSNPFGWQRIWYGVEANQRRELIAFMPQSTCASMWTRCAPSLEQHYPIMTGTYDSFVLVVPSVRKDVQEAEELLHRVLEQQWPQLGGTSYPIETKTGFNWREHTEDNPRGLT